MLVRISPVRGLIILVLFATTTYFIFSRWLSSSNLSYETDQVIVHSSSPPLQNEQSLHSQSKFTDMPMHNEIDQLQFYPLRILPSELSQPAVKRDYITKPLSYNDKSFRESSAPTLWLDKYGDVRWNTAAENGMINYLTQKQFPNLDKIGNWSVTKNEVLNLCRKQSIFILHQHWSGFFSRVLCFIAQFGQTLYSPRIAVFRGTRFSVERGQQDDFLGLGIKRYFLPMSICTAYENHPDMSDLTKLIQSDIEVQQITRTSDLLEYGSNKVDRPLISNEFWKMDYHHVPIRKWLFDRKKPKVSYESPVEILSDHSDEHIYGYNNEKNVSIGDWINTNKPDAFSSDLVNKNLTKLTWQDYVFGSFLRYMFVVYFYSQNAPRIEISTKILTQHWSSYLIDKYSVPRDKNVFDKLAGLYIRRGDKSVEDSFWAKHQRWRNLSFYVKGIIDEEERQNKKFDYIFVMTDDASVMSALQDYADPRSTGKDESYARENLRGRDILYNVLAPQKCFDPFQRIGFDQFLVSMRFLIQNSAFTIGHTDSNVFRFFREVVYAQRQHQSGVQSYTYVRNAPDSFANIPQTATKTTTETVAKNKP
ncbi:unnamed protein product [Adineta steineri]|uniref:Uncharacterized protein n=1 Tax=Adineta steineri TaxID=433720 RepID=A0A819CXU5_9BILA|nr:unnamed protein product [Adineta steineri]